MPAPRKPRTTQLFRLCLVLITLAACTAQEPVPSSPTNTIEPDATEAAGPTAVQSPEPLAQGLIQTPVLDSARATAAALLAAERLPHDYYESAVKLLGTSPEELTPAEPPEPPLEINDRANFYYNATLNGDYRVIPARLRMLSDHAAWWTSVNSNVADEEITVAIENFEETVLPTNRLVFGKEWSPGIDGDPLIHFLIVEEESWEGIFGYFNRLNEFPLAIEPFSNMREMLVLNATAFPLDSDTFPGKLAHEYQHLIQWNVDPDEALWLNEAFSELAYFLTGAPTIKSAFGPTNAGLFALYPEIQLTSRPERRYGENDQSSFIHYGAERAFMVYLFEQFGPQFVKDLAANPAPGVISIMEELEKIPGARTFDDVFADWLVANLLIQPNLGEGHWGYSEYTPVRPKLEVVQTFSGTPIAADLPPYGARYYEIHSEESVHVSFKGSTMTRLTPADPAGGSYAWYSGRGDSSAFRLTRAFDLSGLASATLNYKVWYELEDLLDFAYVEVSTDQGETWSLLQTAFGTDHNPEGNNYGFGYTGASIDWLAESLDLSSYAGQEILLRFEVITDFATNRDGLMLDDIEIPELGFIDGAEDDTAGWEAVGFVRSTNFVPVNWIVWLIELASPTRVTRIEVSDLAEAEFVIAGFGSEFPFAAVVISPAAPVSTLDVPYELVFEHP